MEILGLVLFFVVLVISHALLFAVGMSYGRYITLKRFHNKDEEENRGLKE